MSVNVKQNGELVKIANNISMVQANWNETDDSKASCIRNKPDTLKTINEINENTDENALVSANAIKELSESLGHTASYTDSVYGMNFRRKGNGVYINWSSTGTTISADQRATTLFTLPSDFRPSYRLRFPIYDNSFNFVGLLEVASSGDVSILSTMDNVNCRLFTCYIM